MFSIDEEAYIGELAVALSSVELTEREMEDMRALYKCTNGIPFEGVDSRNRPQSRTIQSSRTLGSKIKRAIGAPEGHFGMSIIGYGQGDEKWYMKDVFRAAIDLVQLFGPDGIAADELLPEDEPDDEEAIIEVILNDDALTETEREQLIQARVGQGKFRSRVELVSPVCRLTGVSEMRFLRASHIKPWRACTHVERLDGNNGLMLAPHVDFLFDQGYITFEDDGTLLISPDLPADILKQWSLLDIANMGSLNEAQAKYMEYHRQHEFLH